MKAGPVELLQTEFAPHPDFRSSAINRRDVTYLNALGWTESFYPISVKHCEFVFRAAEPDAALSVRAPTHR
jgi:hypothetical protein